MTIYVHSPYTTGATTLQAGTLHTLPAAIERAAIAAGKALLVDSQDRPLAVLQDAQGQVAGFVDGDGSVALLPSFGYTGGTGTLDAIVQHRTGTKAALVALGSAPIGEIAVPTDENSLVVYKADGPFTMAGSGAVTISTGGVSGAVTLNVPDSATSVHIAVTPWTTPDITLVLPSAPSLGRSVVMTVDLYLPTTKTVAVQHLGVTVSTFTPADRVTATYIVSYYDPTTPGSTIEPPVWSITREQVSIWGDSTWSQTATNLNTANAFGVAGGAGRFANSLAAGGGAIAGASQAVVIGANARAGSTGWTGGGLGLGAIALGGPTSGGTATGDTVASFDYGIALGTPNTENQRASYYRVGRDHARVDFALYRGTALSAATELSLNGQTGTGTAAGGNRFVFVRVGLYVLDLLCTARVIGTNKAYLLSKRVLVLNDATAGALLVGSQALGTAINSGLTTNITADPFVVTVDAATKTLRVTFTPTAFTDGNMIAQAGVSTFMAIAA
jgi:hypothetical protein